MFMKRSRLIRALRRLMIVMCVAAPCLTAAPQPAEASVQSVTKLLLNNPFFKPIMKALSKIGGIPTFDFVSLPAAIANLPPSMLKTVKQNIGLSAKKLATLARSGKPCEMLNIDSQACSLAQMQIDNPIVKKYMNTNLHKFSSIKGIVTNGSAIVLDETGMDDQVPSPREVGNSVENMMMVRKSNSSQARRKQGKVRERFVRSNLVEASAYAASVQAQIQDIPKLIADQYGEITKPGDLNEAQRNAFVARQTLSSLLALYQKTAAMRLQLRSAQETARKEPLDEPVANLLEPTYHPGVKQEGQTRLAGLFSKPAHAANARESMFVDGGVPGAGKVDEALLLEISEVGDLTDDAIETHNYIYKLIQGDDSISGYKKTIGEHERSLWLLNANEGCNIQQLGHYFENPREVWESMVAFAQAASEAAYAAATENQPAQDLYESGDLAVEMTTNDTREYRKAKGREEGGGQFEDAADDDEDVGSAQGSQSGATDSIKNDEGYTETEGPDESQGDDETFLKNKIAWDVGRAVLMHMYAHQEQWGEVKEFFPLWEDQKTLYDRDWEEYYTKIKMYYKAYHNADVPMGPVVSDTIKYNKNFFPRVQEAHNDFVAEELPVPPDAAPTYICNGETKPCYPMPPLDVLNADEIVIGTVTPEGNVANAEEEIIGRVRRALARDEEGEIIGFVAENGDPLPPFKVIVDTDNEVVGYKASDDEYYNVNGDSYGMRIPKRDAQGEIVTDDDGEVVYVSALQDNGDILAYDGETVKARLVDRGPTIVNNDGNAVGYALGETVYGTGHTAIGTVEAGQTALGPNGNAIGQVEELDASAPPPPPEPLPPWKEILHMQTVEDNFYPEVPEPWQEVISEADYKSFMVFGGLDNFIKKKDKKKLKKKDVDVLFEGLDKDLLDDMEGGELHQLVKTLKLKKKGLGGLFSGDKRRFFYLDPDKMPITQNRVSAYLNLKRREEEIRPDRQNADEALREIEEDIRDLLAAVGYTLSGNFDLTKPADHKMAVQRLKQAKSDLLIDARDAFNQARKTAGREPPQVAAKRLDKMGTMLDALKYEDTGLVKLYYANVAEVKRMKEKAVADENATEAYQGKSDQIFDSKQDEVGCPIY